MTGLFLGYGILVQQYIYHQLIGFAVLPSVMVLDPSWMVILSAAVTLHTLQTLHMAATSRYCFCLREVQDHDLIFMEIYF